MGAVYCVVDGTSSPHLSTIQRKRTVISRLTAVTPELLLLAVLQREAKKRDEPIAVYVNAVVLTRAPFGLSVLQFSFL